MRPIVELGADSLRIEVESLSDLIPMTRLADECASFAFDSHTAKEALLNFLRAVDAARQLHQDWRGSQACLDAGLVFFRRFREAFPNLRERVEALVTAAETVENSPFWKQLRERDAAGRLGDPQVLADPNTRWGSLLRLRGLTRLSELPGARCEAQADPARACPGNPKAVACRRW